MAHLARLAPLAAKSAAAVYGQQQRLMASAAAATQASDPIQRLFLDKVKELKTNFKGLDEAHEKVLADDLTRLKRVYSIDDEAKIAQLKYDFANEHDVSLRDLDESKERRQKWASGELQAEAKLAGESESALLASIPSQEYDKEFHLPPSNKPAYSLLLQADEERSAPFHIKDIEYVPDYKDTLEKMTPHSLQRKMRLMFGPDMPTIDDDKNPERDVVNFPRQSMPRDTPPTRHHLIPESWFQALYPKTGLSGFYTFLGTFSTFLVSKEYIVLEHEITNGFCCFVIFAYYINRFGPRASAWLRNKINDEEAQWEEWRNGSIDFLGRVKDEMNAELRKGNLLDDLYEARKEDVNCQLELEHRKRFKKVFDDTKRKLNYLVSVAESKQAIMQKYMVDWVISNSVKSLGPKQEGEVLESCIANLKQLSVKHANVI